jgi:hypothetical protein
MPAQSSTKNGPLPARLRIDPQTSEDGRLVGCGGCRKGGYARAEKYHPKYRTVLARRAAAARWSKK